MKSDSGAARATTDKERIARLGIPRDELTDSVTLAISALLEKLDDVSDELAQAQASFLELEQMVDVDCVAPVPNRRAFMRRLAWALAMHRRYGHPCSILYFDVNDFKRFNDGYGHAAGDEVIRHVSRILQDSLRQSDYMARLGGDEFAIIMYHARREHARERGRKIAAKLAQNALAFGDAELPVMVACGVYEPGREDDPETALARADEEMYRDKKRLKTQDAAAHASV